MNHGFKAARGTRRQPFCNASIGSYVQSYSRPTSCIYNRQSLKYPKLLIEMNIFQKVQQIQISSATAHANVSKIKHW